MRELRGHWWLPSRPERKVCGVLNLKDGDWARLSLIGSFTDLPDPAGFHAELVIGMADGELITLVDCEQSKVQVRMPGGTTQELISGVVLQGVGFETPGEIQFDRVVVRLRHLDEWPT